VDDVELPGALKHRKAMCTHSATLASIVESTDQPNGAVAYNLAVVTESAVAKQRHAMAGRPLGEQ
jgi:hypothetical protein